MTSPRIIKETGLFEHKWYCIKCEKTWFLSVDFSKGRDRERLQKYYSAISIHTMENDDHEVIHKEKEVKFSYRYT